MDRMSKIPGGLSAGFGGDIRLRIGILTGSLEGVREVVWPLGVRRV
jgi:hypothetical protein